MRTRTGRLLAVIAILITCSCGAETLWEKSYDPGVGAEAGRNDMLIRNAFMIGGAAGDPLQPGADVPMYVTLVSERTTPDRLVSVTSPRLFDGFRLPGGGLTVPPSEPVGGGPAPQALLTGLTRELRSGSYVPVTFQFERAGAISTQVPVLPPSQWRSTYRPWPSPGRS